MTLLFPMMTTFSDRFHILIYLQILKAHPFMRHLMTPVQDPPLTLKMATHLLKPSFSPEGSNQRSQESTVYQKFIKYLREISGQLKL
jgi:hypothetical protein